MNERVPAAPIVAVAFCSFEDLLVFCHVIFALLSIVAIEVML